MNLPSDKSASETSLDSQIRRATTGWIGGALLFLLAFLPYSAALSGDFIWDDLIMIKQNHAVQAANGLKYIWTSTSQIDCFPLTYTTFWIEWRLWGGNTVGYHVLNTLLHAASAVLFWRVLLRLRIPAAWLAALIFAVHPVNVESVAWISERKNVLSMFFYFASFLSFLRFEAERRKRFYALALAMFVLALLSKSSVVMLPCALLVCAWWQRKKITLQDFRRTVPFFLLSAVMGLVTMWFQFYGASGGHAVNSTGFLTRMAVAGRAVWFYLEKIILPRDLMVIYPLWQINERDLSVYAPALLLVLTFVLLWRKRDSWGAPYLAALGYFVVMLFPVIGFLSMYYQTLSWVADHFQQLAFPAIIALLVGGAAALTSRTRLRLAFFPELAGLIVVVVLSLASFKHSHTFLNHHAMWTDLMAKNPESPAASINLGVELASAGKNEEAIRYFKRFPNDPEAQFDWGNSLMNLERYEESIPHLYKATQLRPWFAIAYSQLGSVYAHLGRTNEALNYYLKTVQLEPLDFRAQNNAADLLLQQGRVDEALPHVTAAVAAAPDRAEPHFNAAKILLSRNEYEKAVNCANRALERKRKYPEALVCKAVALSKLNRHNEAAEACIRAINFKPDYPEAHYNYGNALLKLKKADEAEREYLEAVKLNPNLAEAHYQLGAIYAGRRQLADALVHWRKTVELDPEWPEALNNLAWALATAKEDNLRNGPEAIRLARRAADLEKGSNLETFDTLAAAYAEASLYDDAVRIAGQALELAKANQQTALAETLSQRLVLYRSRKAYRE